MKFKDLKFGEHFLLDGKEYICSRSPENPYVKCISVDLQDLIEVDDTQEVTKLNSYRVAGEYTCVFEVEVYAESLEDADYQKNCSDKSYFLEPDFE